jgi:hypothetical protein
MAIKKFNKSTTINPQNQKQERQEKEDTSLILSL